jgi:lysyl endopeptidase
MNMNTKIGTRTLWRLCAAFLLSASALVAHSAPSINRLNVDISPLIDEAARYPDRFAVDVVHPISAATMGAWTTNGGVSTWTYAVRIDTAISMAFHASSISLPPSAELKVTGASGSVSYAARDVRRGELWSRHVVGSTLSLSLTVKSTERAQVRFEIQSLQAGYRGIAGVIADNPHYRQILKASADGDGDCTQNYICNATPSNQNPAQATVAIVIANIGQCSGTLLNDTRGDGTPYVLTARHCETGKLGGGSPQAAGSITVYWDAVTPCGTALASIYDVNVPTQSGATTIVEQQDAWLLQLDQAPVVADAYFAGWDASGASFSGGYSIHHALGNNKQFVSWFGQPLQQSIPAATLNVGYDSSFLGVVNQLGRTGAGASGGALIDSNNRAVGSASLAQLVNGQNTAGVCPAATPATPTPDTITAQFTSLAAIWNSTSDTTSTTGTATLQSALDTAGTGKLVQDGMGLLQVTLTASNPTNSTTVLTGDTLTLAWNSPGATSCIASGGAAGDGWAGPRAASGSFQLTEQAGGQLSYALKCSAAGSAGSASVSVFWQFIPVVVNLNGSPNAAAGGSVMLDWAATSGPCTASGGTSGDGWAGPKAQQGSQTLIASVIGTVNYILTCGPTARTGTSQVTTTVVAPYVFPIFADANQMRIGTSVNLNWGSGGHCVASGGAAGDGWAGSIFLSTNGGSQDVIETAPGTYTYTITCTGAGQTVSTSKSLTFTGNAAAVSVTATPTQAQVYTDSGSAGLTTINFTTNVRPCTVTYVGPVTPQGQLNAVSGTLPNGSVQDSEGVAGNYVYTVTCGSGSNVASATTSVNWFTSQPAVTLNVANPIPLGSAAGIAWVTNVYPCVGTGGQTGDGWAGPKVNNHVQDGDSTIVENTLGSMTFGITCGSGAQIVHAQATSVVIAAAASITASSNSAPIGSVVQIQWTANFEPCTSSITPGSSQGWGTILGKTGGFQATQNTPGTYTYAVNCGGAVASTQVTFTGTLQGVTLAAATASAPVSSNVFLNWNALSGSVCLASGGTGSDGWNGTLGASGSMQVTSAASQVVTYSISCTDPQSNVSQAQTQVAYTIVSSADPTNPVPNVSLSTSQASLAVGGQVTLNWSSQNAAACTASGGTGSDGWNGGLSTAGQMVVTESASGEYTYAITCFGAPPAASAQVKVEFTSASPAGSAKSGGGGGIGPLSLLFLGLLAVRRVFDGKSRRTLGQQRGSL